MNLFTVCKFCLSLINEEAEYAKVLRKVSVGWSWGAKSDTSKSYDNIKQIVYFYAISK